VVVDETHVYWSAAEELVSVPKSGGARRVFTPRLCCFSGIAVDETHVFYTMSNTGLVGRVPK
jgi:hypothetical protein